MKTKFIRARNNNIIGATIILGRAEKALWQTGTADGPDIADAAERVKNAAQDFANRIGHTVYVYAPASAGGWMWDQIEPADR